MLSVETLDEIEGLWNEQREAEAALVAAIRGQRSPSERRPLALRLSDAREALVSVTFDHIPALVEAGRAALRHPTD